MLAAWFGPLWADKHKLDSQGLIFLNCDPYCFEQILSFLRCKLIEHPERPAQLPVVRQESQAEFATLVTYLGLAFYMPSGAYHFSKTIAALLTAGGCVAETVEHHNNQSVALAVPAMQLGTLSYLKCTILLNHKWMFLGVTQLCEPQRDAEEDPSSCGWSTSDRYDQGQCRTFGWQTGDELVFKINLTLDMGMLSVWSSRHSCVFDKKLNSAFHGPFFFMCSAELGSKVQLSPASLKDKQHFA